MRLPTAFCNVVLPLQGLQIGGGVVAIGIEAVDFPAVFGITAAVLAAGDPGTAGVLAPMGGFLRDGDGSLVPDGLDGFFFYHDGRRSS